VSRSGSQIEPLCRGSSFEQSPPCDSIPTDCSALESLSTGFAVSFEFDLKLDKYLIYHFSIDVPWERKEKKEKKLVVRSEKESFTSSTIRS
jgi:hypothetical protein